MQEEVVAWWMDKWNIDKKKKKDKSCMRGEKKKRLRNQVYHGKTSQQIPMWVSPYSHRSYSFFIYLQLSAGAQADKQLQLPYERLTPQPGPYLMISKCMIKYVV